MKSRKDFIATVAGAGALYAAVATPRITQAAAEATPLPSPTPSPKPPSEDARAFAAKMRAFDPALTDKQLSDIAGGIDFYRGVGQRINPKGKALKDSAEPATRFEVNP